MRKYLSGILLGICIHATQWASGTPAISAQLFPNEIQPGDIFRLQVSRVSGDFAVFELDVPLYEHLHLLGREKTPVAIRNGRYEQKETWIFQADMSGEIALEGIQVNLISGTAEESIPLPTLKLLVIPYPVPDKETAPLELDMLRPQEISGHSRTYFFITFLLTVTVAGCVLVIRKKLISREQPGQPVLWDRAISDLERGVMNPDSLYLLLEEQGDTLPIQVKLAIEQAIYANRGHPAKLAETMRKEGRP